MIEWLNNIDTQLFLLINGAGSPYLDGLMDFLSTKKTWYPFYALLLYFLIRKTRWKFYMPLLGIVALITLCDQFTSSFMKPFFERFRPCNEPTLEGLVYTFKGCGGLYGFASSHAANSFGLAFFFHFIFKNKYTLLLLLWAFMVSYSRVYLGAHYPGDIVVGGLLGWLFAYLIFQLIQKTKFRMKGD